MGDEESKKKTRTYPRGLWTWVNRWCSAITGAGKANIYGMLGLIGLQLLVYQQTKMMGMIPF